MAVEKTPLSNAERQARHRAKRKANAVDPGTTFDELLALIREENVRREEERSTGRRRPLIDLIAVMQDVALGTNKTGIRRPAAIALIQNSGVFSRISYPFEIFEDGLANFEANTKGLRDKRNEARRLNSLDEIEREAEERKRRSKAAAQYGDNPNFGRF